MSKRINELAFKYNIDARTDKLSLFVSEIYNDGFSAGKETQQAFNTKITLRDHFAGLAMQKLSLAGHPPTAYKDLATLSYQIADAMLKEREVGDDN
jgi:hypothetical protein